MAAWQTIKVVTQHCATGIDGRTYDPARVIGYGSAVLVVLSFVFCQVYNVVINKIAFDASAAGIGAGAILAAVAAVGAGVAAKSKTEPGQGV